MDGKFSRRHTPGSIARQLGIVGGLLVVIPLVFYPRSLGFPPFDLNPAIGLLEWAFYVAVLSISTSRLQFSTRIVAAGFTVVFRLALAVLSGALVAPSYNQPWTSTIFEMMWSYPLALVPQVLCAPVLLSSFWEHLLAPKMKPVTNRRLRTANAVSTGLYRSTAPALMSSAASSRLSSSVGLGSLEPTFDDAVSYIGEYAGVRQCWIVDSEGLPLAVWERQQYTGDADFWSPVSVDLIDYLRSRLSAGGGACHPQRFEMRTDEGRLIVEAAREMWLGVLTDPETDDLINVRITRACEMIAKTMRMKGGSAVATGEVQYV